MERYQEIERSIIKKYRKDIWSKFVKAVIEYDLVKENDKIMVCISGGKDSFLLAKCMEELQKHGKFPFEVCYVCMNPGYNEANLNLIKENAKTMNIDLEIFESDIFDIVSTVENNKIALGHHFDDVIETTLLSMFYGAEVKTMMPKLHSENFEGLELIRPLHMVKEADIIAWAKTNNLKFLNCACRFTEKSVKNEEESKRLLMKNLVKKMRKDNPNIDYNIYKALDNVNLNCVIGTKTDGEYESFLANYDNKSSK